MGGIHDCSVKVHGKELSIDELEARVKDPNHPESLADEMDGPQGADIILQLIDELRSMDNLAMYYRRG